MVSAGFPIVQYSTILASRNAMVSMPQTACDEPSVDVSANHGPATTQAVTLTNGPQWVSNLRRWNLAR
jgi:hypothetical protein